MKTTATAMYSSALSDTTSVVGNESDASIINCGLHRNGILTCRACVSLSAGLKTFTSYPSERSNNRPVADEKNLEVWE